jgi:hypothetical protein
VSFSDVTADDILDLDVDVLRFEASEWSKVRRILDTLEADIQRLVFDTLGDDADPRDINALLKPLAPGGNLIDNAYTEINALMQADLPKMAAVVGSATVKKINTSLGVNLLQVPTRARFAAMGNPIIEGKPASVWWKSQDQQLRGLYNQAIREGLDNEETIPQIMRRVHGTRKAGFKDGLMEISRRDAAALVRTSVQSVKNEARMTAFLDNTDVVKGVQAINPLDDRTSTICQARAGHAWLIPSGDPFPGTTEHFPGPPPWHFQCRTDLNPILYPINQLKGVSDGTKEKLGDRSKKSRLTGEPADDLFYEDWLKRQSVERQKDVLGPGKWELWKDGDIGMSDLIDQSGNPLTLGELEQRHT